jgi:hypothetical protein
MFSLVYQQNSGLFAVANEIPETKRKKVIRHNFPENKLTLTFPQGFDK